MQETRYTGIQLMTERATPEQIQKAIANPENQSVLVGAPGAHLTSKTGAEYVVQRDGSLKRTNKPLSKKARRRLRKEGSL